MKKSESFVDRIDTKLLIFLTCIVLIVSVVMASGMSIAKDVIIMKQSIDATDTATTTAITENVAPTSAVNTVETYSETQSRTVTDTTTSTTAQHTTTTEITSTQTDTTTSPTTSTAPENTVSSTTKDNTEADTTRPTSKEPVSATTTTMTAKTPRGDLYYVTASGTKYHVDGCSYLGKSKISIYLSDAIAEGYTPCSRCIGK